MQGIIPFALDVRSLHATISLRARARLSTRGSRRDFTAIVEGAANTAAARPSGSLPPRPIASQNYLRGLAAARSALQELADEKNARTRLARLETQRLADEAARQRLLDEVAGGAGPTLAGRPRRRPRQPELPTTTEGDRPSDSGSSQTYKFTTRYRAFSKAKRNPSPLSRIKVCIGESLRRDACADLDRRASRMQKECSRKSSRRKEK